MASEWQETALSEVIGFILILAIITAAASLYIVYVVPAQGREAEIRHMEYISSEFTGYKIGIDSLWINDREDVTISRTVSLGTLGVTTQGSFLNLPLFQPYGSSGTMVVNGRGDTIGYEVDGAVTEGSGGMYNPDSILIVDEPKHLYIGFLTDDVTQRGGVLLESSEGDWEVWLNITRTVRPQPSTTITKLPILPTNPGGQYKEQTIGQWIKTYLVDWLEIQYDLTITVIKNGNETLSNWVIRRDIRNGTYYTVDLFDEAYGLSSEELSYPFSLLRNGNPTLGEVSTYSWLKTKYPHGFAIDNVSISPHPMGSLEYRSNNYYWIQQNYYYQDGAVFLEQPGDGSVVKVLPSINIRRYENTNNLIVQITDIVINSTPRSLGGTGSVEITSFVSEVTEGETVDGTRFATGIPNAKKVVITVDADDEPSALAWDGAFRQVNKTAPPGWSSIDPHIDGSTTSTFQITGNNPDEYDILLDYTRVNISASLQSVAA